MGIFDGISGSAIAHFQVSYRFFRAIDQLVGNSTASLKPITVSRLQQKFLGSENQSWGSCQYKDKFILLGMTVSQRRDGTG